MPGVLAFYVGCEVAAAVETLPFVRGPTEFGVQVLCQALPAAIVKRTAAMYELLKSSYRTGFQPRADMYINGHGEHWHSASNYVLRHQTVWERVLTQ